MTIIIVGLMYLVIGASLVLAQGTTAITPTTGGSSLNTKVTIHGHTVQITDGTRPGNGANLFHSFDQFNVGRGDTAQFLNTTPSLHTSNILGRVTGENPSSIFGTVDTMSYPGANLFLMNPAGIVFGPNATLNVGGSVSFTTADYLRFTKADGSNAGIFHADMTATSLLTNAPIAAFGFLGSNPAAIAVQGSMLTVQPGQSLSLVGGNHGFTYTNPASGTSISVPDGVTVTGGHLRAPGGQINIVSVASTGEILAGNLDQASNINGQSFGTLGTVQISEQGRIDSSGAGGGTILIRGGRLTISDAMISANTQATEPNAEPKSGSSKTGIDIQVKQDAVIDGSVIEANVKSRARNESGGNILLKAGSIEIKNSGQIETNTGSIGNSGHITLWASGKIDINSKSVVNTSASEGSSGQAGNIELTSGHGDVTIKDNAAVLTFTDPNSLGNTGRIKIDASNGSILLSNFSSIFNTSSGTGTLGAIHINAHDLRLENTSSIGGDNNSDTQVPGNIIIALDGYLKLVDGSQLNTGALKSTNSADLIVSASSVLITGKGSGIFTNTIGTGAGGKIDLTANSVTLQNGGTLSAETSGTASSAKGGAIIVSATDRVTLTNGASITASTNGPGDAGNILVKADNIALSGGSTITASSTGSGNAGTVTIQGLQSPSKSFFIDGSNSGVFTKTTKTGAGGDITVSSNSILIQNEGRISGETSGTDVAATGGKIRVDGGQIRIENGALVTSSSTGVATSGNIALTAGQSITIQDRASISASSTGSGNAGNITLIAGQQLDVRDSPKAITTDATKASGGNIDIRAIDHIRFANSQINASVGADKGNGGNITIDPNVVVLQNSQIRAQAVEGRGGNITITTPLFLRDSPSTVDASSLFGLHGFVVIRTPTSNLSGTVAQLASKPSEIQALLQSRCIALAGGEQSTFIVAGRDALPSEPGGWLSSPVSMEHWMGEDTEHASGLMVRRKGSNGLSPMGAHGTETAVLSLRRLTPPGFLVRTFGIDGLTGCRS